MRRRVIANRDTKCSAAVGKDFLLSGNHFPLLSRQVSEWRSDLPQAHSWERRDRCVPVSALPTASTWGSISFRALVHSPPASFILAAGRQTQRGAGGGVTPGGGLRSWAAAGAQGCHARKDSGPRPLF